MEKKYKKILVIPMIIGLMACSSSKIAEDDAGAYDEVNKPAASDEADMSTIKSPQEIKGYFETRTSRIETSEMKNKLIMYSQEEKDELCDKLAEYLPSFWDGANSYLLDEALDAYEAALSLSYTSDDINDDYHYIGYWAADGLSKLYGVEFTEESVEDICIEIRQSCIKLQDLGYLDENFNPTSWYD